MLNADCTDTVDQAAGICRRMLPTNYTISFITRQAIASGYVSFCYTHTCTFLYFCAFTVIHLESAYEHISVHISHPLLLMGDKVIFTVKDKVTAKVTLKVPITITVTNWQTAQN